MGKTTGTTACKAKSTTLADALAALDDDALSALLRARPDLASSPPPASFIDLAARASTWRSMATCLEGLDLFAIQLVNFACLLPDGASRAEWSALAGPDIDDDDVDAAVDRLRSVALVWGDDHELRLVAIVRQQIPHPARLGRPVTTLAIGLQRPGLDGIATALGLSKAGNKQTVLGRVATALADPELVRARVTTASRGARRILEEADQVGPTCHVPPGYWWHGGIRPRNDLDWLLAHGLLMLTDWSSAEVPREVGLALRGGHPYAGLRARRPALEVREVDPATVDKAAAAAAEAVLRNVAGMLQELADTPARPLKAGGLGARELRRLAKAVEVDAHEAGRLLEVALSAGLVNLAEGDEVAPTARFDEWLALSPAERWLDLVQGWLALDRHPSLSGHPDADGKLLPALDLDGLSSFARLQRQRVLTTLTGLDSGQAPVPASMVAAVDWQEPYLWAAEPLSADLLGGWVLTDAGVLGVTGQGALSPAGRALLAGDDEAAARMAQVMLPPPSNEFTLQADLTCIAPAALDGGVRAELTLMADVESSGVATVLRFSEGSIRRALDAGRSTDDVLAFLEEHAPRGIPQPLSYLVTDVGRRHGAIRVGGVGAYVRSDDVALMAQVLRMRRAGTLGLHLVAPTVAVASVGPAELLAALRTGGFLPVEEAPGGGVVVTRPAAHRSARRPLPRPGGGRRPPAPIDTAEVVARLRAPTPAASAAPRPVAPGPALANLWDLLDEPMLAGGDTDGSAIVGDDDYFAFDEEIDLGLLYLAQVSRRPLWVAFDDPEVGDGEVLASVTAVTGDHVVLHLLNEGEDLTLSLAAIEWIEVADADERGRA